MLLNTLALTEKKRIRQTIRQQRRSLNPLQQKIAAKELFKNAVKSQLFIRHRHIALYLSSDGEIDTRYILSFLKKTPSKIYLPTIHPLNKHQIVFCRFRNFANLTKNRFGISEPHFSSKDLIAAQNLSLVLFPLVAFDSMGNRLGMGGGFYDKAFKFKLGAANSPPRLIGLAHDFQKQKQLPTEPWDIKLHGVMTDKKMYR